MRSRACTTPLSRRLRMCAQAACCRSSRNCRRCGIALPNPGSGGTKFVSRSVPLRSLSNCRAGVLSVISQQVIGRSSSYSDFLRSFWGRGTVPAPIIVQHSLPVACWATRSGRSTPTISREVAKEHRHCTIGVDGDVFENMHLEIGC